MNWHSLSLLSSGLVSLLLGVFILWQGPRKLPNLTLSFFSVALCGWCAGQFLGEVIGPKTAVLFWTRFNLGAAVLLPILYLHFILAFTDQVRKNLPALRLGYLMAAGLLLLDFTPLFVADIAPRFGFRYYPVPGMAYPFFALYLLAFFGLGLVKLVRFIGQSAGAENNQARYVLTASLIGFIGGVTAFFPVFEIDLPVLSHLALPLYLALTVYAIVKHKLLNISIVIRAGLVYSALTVFFAGFYTLFILLADYFFSQLTSLSELLTILAVVFVSVAVFQPLRDRVQQLVDRLFFRGSYYYQRTIADLSEENLRLYRSLLQADKLAALGVLAAGMAHEIKNPLASLKGLTQILPENLHDRDFIARYAEIVPRQLDRINRIVEELLDFGQPKSLLVGEVKLDQAVDEVVRLVENQCRQANIEIVRDYQPLPALPADRDKLYQAFVNIILNAVQSMKSGGRLKLRLYRTAPYAVVEVADTGAGVPADRLPNIFDPFYTTKEGGSGMGLAVTYRIIKEHGGEIAVESTVGKGTTFKICLPIRPERSA